MTVQRDASLHEKAVQKVARESLTFNRRERSPGRTLARTTSHIVVNRAVWKAAVKAAGGDKSRLRIIDAVTVVVR